MEINFLYLMWITYTSVITLLGVNFLCINEKVPFFLSRLFKFGKLGKNLLNKKSFARYLEVPKRWFGHFYIFATIYFLIIVIEIGRRYFMGNATNVVTNFLDISTSKNRKSSVTPESVVIMSILLLLQASRRAYECYFVSIYSEAMMSIFHYIVGFTFYMGVGQSLLYEAPGFESEVRDFVYVQFSNNWITWQHLIGMSIFLCAFALQYKAHITLANLRKDPKGKKVVTLNHVMPSGGWFELVSCPHFFAEIVMYCSANIIFNFKHQTWWLVCLWTIACQVVIGLLSHQWYQKNFKNYPKSRKAVIPFLL